MSRVMVHIETDHTDDSEAALSVMNALKRAGYDVLDHQVEGSAYMAGSIRNTMYEFVTYSDPILVTASEPECDRSARNG